MIVVKDKDERLHCGGSIASSNRIITAGHCFIDAVTKKKMTRSKIQTFKIQVGTDIPFESQGQ